MKNINPIWNNWLELNTLLTNKKQLELKIEFLELIKQKIKEKNQISNLTLTIKLYKKKINYLKKQLKMRGYHV